MGKNVNAEAKKALQKYAAKDGTAALEKDLQNLINRYGPFVPGFSAVLLGFLKSWKAKPPATIGGGGRKRVM